MMSIEKLSVVWPEWNVVEQIGEGSFGKVYKVVREEHTMTTYAAVKVISIPQSDSEVSSLRSEGLDEEASKTYFEGVVNDFVNEIKLMESMKGTSNVVSVEDFKVLPKEDKIGWDIFIRMELLIPFNKYLESNQMTEQDVIKLGTDISTALELCAQKNIIHRDIKPENIFISSFGDFKVGDFGIAKELEKTSGALSSKGTYNYMAPEIAAGKQYDATVDIYSLGLVLYKLLNNNRLPFIDPYATQIPYQDRKNATDKRLAGEIIPPPVNASPQLAEVILAACSYDPAQRFSTPTAFKNALLSVSDMGVRVSPTQSQPKIDLNATTAARPAERIANPTVYNAQPQMQNFNKPQAKPKKEKKKLTKGQKAKIILITIASAIIVLAITLACLFFTSPSYSAFKNMKDKNYSSALSDYNDGVEGNFIYELVLNGCLNGYDDKIVEQFENGELDYNSAVEALRTLEKMKFKGISEKITEITAIKDADSALEKGDKYYENGDYGNAIKEYSKIPESNENYTAVTEKLSDSTKKYKESVIAEAKKSFEKKDYESAIKTLSDARVTIENDEDIEKLYAEYVSAYEKDCVDQSQKYFNEKDYDRAISTLEHGLEVLPESKVISDKLNEVKAAKPIKLVDTDVLYDGVCYKKFTSATGESFSIGSQTYYEGFEIWDDHSLFGDGDGYALFDLQGKYSEISFDVGRTNEYEMQDVTLKVYLNDKFVEDYPLSAQSGHKSITINLAYAKNMKLEVTGGSRVKYGFVNVYLKK